MAKYELITIHAGKITVLLESETKQPVVKAYLETYRRQYNRIRIEGEVLTIREADEFCGMKWQGLSMDWKAPVRKVKKERYIRQKYKGRAVELLDDDGQVVAKYESITQAAEDLDTTRLMIGRWARGERKPANGLILRYADKG